MHNEDKMDLPLTVSSHTTPTATACVYMVTNICGSFDLDCLLRCKCFSRESWPKYLHDFTSTKTDTKVSEGSRGVIAGTGLKPLFLRPPSLPLLKCPWARPLTPTAQWPAHQTVVVLGSFQLWRCITLNVIRSFLKKRAKLPWRNKSKTKKIRQQAHIRNSR